MKKIFYAAILLVLPAMTYSQETIVFDQNPRYKESLDRYLKMVDSLTAWHGITIQNTYKAYDWREAREERRKQRRAWRHEERMNRGYYNDYSYPDYYPYGGGRYYTPNYSYPYYNHYANPYGNHWRRFDFGLGFTW